MYIPTEILAFLIRSARNSVAPAPERAAITGGVTIVQMEDRSCCEKAWHCDEGDWYKPCGKGTITPAMKFVPNLIDIPQMDNFRLELDSLEIELFFVHSVGSTFPPSHGPNNHIY